MGSLGAVHMTAGHNALRGSGPGQNRAFKNAVAHVGCPDRRIDRHCITCCSPSQPSHHAGYPARSRYAASATGFLYRSPLAIIAQAMRASLLASAMAATLVGRRASSAVSQGRCAGHEQAAQIAVPLFADTAEPILAPARVLLRHEPDPSREV